MVEKQENPAANPYGKDINLPLVATIGVVGSVAVYVIIVLAQAGFLWSVDQELATKSLTQSSQELADLQMVQQKKIQTYRTLDSARGVVAIPVQRAMELVVAERKRTAEVK